MSKASNEICPADETFVKAFLNESGLKERERLVTHIMACPRCQKKFQVMRQLREELKALDLVPVKSAHAWRFNQRLVAVLGSAVIVIAASFFLLRLEKKPVYRGNGSGKLVLLEPAGFIQKPPSVFTWTPIKGADTYEIRIIDEELNTILASGTKDTELLLSKDTLSKLVRGKTFVWTIKAYDDESRVLDTTSGSFEIR